MNEKLKDITLSLLKFKTRKTEVQGIKDCLSWIEKEFGNGIEVRRFPHDTAPSLLLTPLGVPNPKVLFVGHVDVVAAEESQFEPRVENGRIYGRGSFDMKGPIAACLLAFRSAIEKSIEVGVLITSDEEIGGKEGVERILSEYPLVPEIAIVPDGGNNFEVAEGGKGVGWLDITIRTKAGHVSRPWEGKNAIQVAAKVLTMIEEKYLGMQEIRTDETTLSPISISTENASSNVIPDHAFVSFNLRFTEGFDFEELRELVARFPGVEKVDIKRSIEPYQANIAHPLSQKFLSVLATATSTPVKTSVYPSTCDARFFASRGVPVIVTRSLGDGAHGPDEWVDLESLVLFEEVLEKFLTS
jgi:succinyl-diaminopimelate desuccinylase